MSFLQLLHPTTPFLFELPMEGEFRIGRHPTCDLSLPDPQVSRQHASIRLRPGAAELLDQSRNGTQVNATPIAQRWLKDGDEICISRFAMIFHHERPAMAALETQQQKSSAILGKSPAFVAMMEQAERLAITDFPVLLSGESGTGKDVLARHLHHQSMRAHQPFIVLNCAALPATLIESELFGHEKGAFTHATDRRAGLFECADRGTLFLDEIGDLPLELQPKLLRVLEEGSVRRLGGRIDIPVNVRLLAATHRCLPDEVRAGRFRLDLLHRISVLGLEIPPLRKRTEDIALFAELFLRKAGYELALPPDLIHLLQQQPWPGNLRELRNCLLRAALLNGGPITAAQLKLVLPTVAGDEPARPAEGAPQDLHSSEVDLIVSHLAFHRWNRGKTAASLGISRSTLFLKMRRYGLL